MADNKEGYGWGKDKRPGEEPVTSTYPGRERVGGPKLPQRKSVISVMALTVVIAITSAVVAFVLNRNKAAEETPAVPGAQGGPDATPVAGETTPDRPGQRLKEGLEPPRPEDGVMGSTSVDIGEVTASGGERGRSREVIERILRSSYGKIAGAYMDYCRDAGVTDRRDELFVRFRVTTAGSAADVEVLTNTTGDEGVARAATDAVSRAVFPPAPEDSYVTCRYVLRARLAPDDDKRSPAKRPIKVDRGLK